MTRARVPLVLVAALAASVTAGVGAFRRFSRAKSPQVVPGTPRPATSGTAAPVTPAHPPARADAVEPRGPSATFRGGPLRQNRSAFAGPSRGDLAFSYDAGAPIEAAPALLEDGGAIVATLGGRLARIGAAGEPVWSVDLKERIYASPLVVGDAVFVGSDAKSFRSFALRDGKAGFELKVDGEADTAPVALPNGGIAFAAGKTLYAIRRDGAVRFRFKARRKIYGAPAVTPAGAILFGSQDHRLYALSDEGKLAFSRDLGGDVDCAPAIGDDGAIYAGSDAGKVFAFDAKGNARFAVDVGGYVRGGLTVTRSGAVVAATYGPAPRVIELDGETGAVLWSFSVPGTGAPEYGIHGAPVEDPDRNLYFGAQDDDVYGLDESGKVRLRFHTGGDVDAPLVITPRHLLVAGSDDGRLYFLR